MKKIRINRTFWIFLGGFIVGGGYAYFLIYCVAPKFGLEVALALAALVPAAIAAIAALSSSELTRKSLKITRQSLELSRATTRPFLTYLVKGIEFDEKNQVVLLRIFVSNKGNLPAEKPALQARQYFYQSKPEKSPIDMEEWIQNLPKPSELKKLFKGKDKKFAATYFPTEERNFNFEFGGSSIPEYQKSQYAAIGIAIFYRSMQRDYETIRWFLYDKSKALKVQFKPIPEKDHFT